MKKLLYAGIDLHSNNNYIGIIDQKDEKQFKKKLKNDASLVLSAFSPFQSQIQGIVIESTFNWYWLGATCKGAHFEWETLTNFPRLVFKPVSTLRCVEQLSRDSWKRC